MLNIYQSINQYLFSELQYTIILNNKYVHITSTNDIWHYSSKIQGGVKKTVSSSIMFDI